MKIGSLGVELESEYEHAEGKEPAAEKTHALAFLNHESSASNEYRGRHEEQRKLRSARI